MSTQERRARNKREPRFHRKHDGVLNFGLILQDGDSGKCRVQATTNTAASPVSETGRRSSRGPRSPSNRKTLFRNDSGTPKTLHRSKRRSRQPRPPRSAPPRRQIPCRSGYIRSRLPTATTRRNRLRRPGPLSRNSQRCDRSTRPWRFRPNSPSGLRYLRCRVAEDARTLWQACQADLQAVGRLRDQIDPDTTVNPSARYFGAALCLMKVVTISFCADAMALLAVVKCAPASALGNCIDR